MSAVAGEARLSVAEPRGSGAVERTVAATGGDRAAGVDVLRAVAALAVLIGHAYFLSGRILPVRAQHPYDVPLIATASGVWLFFAISGYVISRPFVDALLTGEPLPGLMSYALRRAARIFPLFWLAFAAYLLIEGTQGTAPPVLVAHILLVNNLIPGHEGALLTVAWTLTLEVLFYVAVPLAALGLARRRTALTAERMALLIALSWAASIAFTSAGDLTGDGRAGLWLRGSFLAMWQMFCPGILLAVLPHLGASSRAAGLIDSWTRGRRSALGIGALLIVAVLVSTLAPLRYGVPIYQLIVDGTRPLFAIGFGLVLARVLRRRGWRPHPWLLELGLISYGIYLIHPVLVDLLLAHPSLIPLHGAGLGASAVHVALIIVLTVPLAMLSWRALERPSIAFARRVGGRAGRTDGARDAGTAGMRDFWNARAREDAFYFVDTRQPYKRTDEGRFWSAEELLDVVLDGLGVKLRGDEHAVEIGCGLGRITRVLAGRVADVAAFDVSDEMLARARELSPDLGNVDWILGDGATLRPLGDGVADCCVSLVVLQHVPDPQITMSYVRELGRVLAPGGWAALQVSNDPSIHRPRTPLGWRVKALLGRAPRGQHHPAWLGSPIDLGELRAVAEAAGMVTERVWGEGSQYCQVLLRRR